MPIPIPVDSFTIILSFPDAVGSTLNFTNTNINTVDFKLPILLDKNINYIRVVSAALSAASIVTDAGNNLIAGPLVIKSSFIAASDKTLVVFSMSKSQTQNVNVFPGTFIKVVDPLSGSISLDIVYTQISSVLNPVFAGTINICIECYSIKETEKGKKY